MTWRSLRLRLTVAAVLSVSLALLIAGVGLINLFERHVGRRVDDELETTLRSLVAALEIDANGRVALTREPGDPRYEQVTSGHYWQVAASGTEAIRSRSLWDHALELPRDELAIGQLHRHRVIGPGGATLRVVERSVVVVGTTNGPGTPTSMTVRVAAATDAAEVTRAVDHYAGELASSLLVLATVLLAAAMAQIFVGLRPLDRVRLSVLDVLAGRRKRVVAEGPGEVMPLVEAVNGLLNAQEMAIASARMRAADLAHGLKTPLAVLATGAERLRARGETDIADEIDDLVAMMRRHVSRELSRARLASQLPRSARSEVGSIATRIARTLARGPRGDEITFEIDVPADVTVPMEPDDLAEVLGALMENAQKWANQRVRVGTTTATGVMQITISDDGPGVPADKLHRLGARGVRLDERVEGNGLGIAIAADILEAYGGSMAFASREGFVVTISLPSSQRSGIESDPRFR
ncbi:MAG: sensor histidine kinase [Hyphomicrobiaceae bacterium]